MFRQQSLSTIFLIGWVVGPACMTLTTKVPVVESLALNISRRNALGWIVGSASSLITGTTAAFAEDPADKIPERLNVDDYLRTGFVSQPMGVSGQAGKSRPETGVVLRDGSDISRDPRSGDVLAEILVQSSSSSEMTPVLASYSSPWPLAKGTVFDVECRDANTGDGVFLAVTQPIKGSSLSDVKDSFFLNNLLAPTGRFSFYGPPTDVKVVKSDTMSNNGNNYRVMDLSFSTLSQSTNAELPRRARLVATIPEGTSQAVMLIASASAVRWKKGSDKVIASVIESFRAIPAPQTSLKVRAKERRSG